MPHALPHTGAGKRTSSVEKGEEKRTSGAPVPDELPSSSADLDLQVREASGRRKEREKENRREGRFGLCSSA
jgi:hypothetical protein